MSWWSVVLVVVPSAAAVALWALWRKALGLAQLHEERAASWRGSSEEHERALRESEKQRQDDMGAHLQLEANLRRDNALARQEIAKLVGSLEDPELRRLVASTYVRDVLSNPPPLPNPLAAAARPRAGLLPNDTTPTTDPGKRGKPR